MIINQTTGQAAIMGTDRRFSYDHASSALVIRDLTFAEASVLINGLEGTNVLVERKGEQLDLVGHAEKANGKGKVTVDPEKMAALAASNPAPPPKAPKKPPKAAKPPVEEDEDDDTDTAEALRFTTFNATEMAALAAQVDDDEEDIPFPEKPAPKKVAAKAAPPPADDDEDDEEEEVAAPPPKKKGKGASEELKAAKKLRDVLVLLLAEYGIEETPSAEEVEKINQRCESLKDEVPCLARITDLESRIGRTLEVMDLDGGIS